MLEYFFLFVAEKKHIGDGIGTRGGGGNDSDDVNIVR